MERRKFIKYTCVLCAGSALLSTLLESCAGPQNLYKAEYLNNEIVIPLVSFGDKNYLIVRADKLSNDIFISRKPDKSYSAFLMRCTHRDAPLHYSTGGLICNEHGSRFNFDGEVIQSPALVPLKKINVSLNDQSLTLIFKHI